jgi:hypothetical protein
MLLSDKECFVNPTILDAKAKLINDIQVIQRAMEAAQGFGADMGVNLRGLAAGVAEKYQSVANVMRMDHICNSWG